MDIQKIIEGDMDDGLTIMHAYAYIHTHIHITFYSRTLYLIVITRF